MAFHLFNPTPNGCDGPRLGGSGWPGDACDSVHVTEGAERWMKHGEAAWI